MTDTATLIATADAAVAAAIGPAARTVEQPHALRDAPTLAGRIDHTLLAADATKPAIERLCAEAAEHGFASVCVNGRWVPLAAVLLQGSPVLVCTVVGFPLGAMAHRAKAGEAAVAVADGAGEVDMVLDVGGLKSGDLAGVFDDIRGVVQAASPSPVKVILETCLLDDEQVATACLLAVRAGAAYVKTSTGMNRAGATAHHVALMRAAVGPDMGVKASGGVRTRADAEEMLAAGADRIGASASVAIVSTPAG